MKKSKHIRTGSCGGYPSPDELLNYNLDEKEAKKTSHIRTSSCFSRGPCSRDDESFLKELQKEMAISKENSNLTKYKIFQKMENEEEKMEKLKHFDSCKLNR